MQVNNRIELTSSAYENYLVRNLEEDKDIKICFISHNPFWKDIETIKLCYPNFDIDTFANGLSGLNPTVQERDYDIIIVSSTKVKNEDTLHNAEEMVQLIASEFKKQVTLGYQYQSSMDKTELNLISYSEQGKDYDIITPVSGKGAMDILNLTTCIHAELKKSKKYRK